MIVIYSEYYCVILIAQLLRIMHNITIMEKKSKNIRKSPQTPEYHRLWRKRRKQKLLPEPPADGYHKALLETILAETRGTNDTLTKLLEMVNSVIKNPAIFKYNTNAAPFPEPAPIMGTPIPMTRPMPQMEYVKTMGGIFHVEAAEPEETDPLAPDPISPIPQKLPPEHLFGPDGGMVQ